jgi:hypothetical protein
MAIVIALVRSATSSFWRMLFKYSFNVYPVMLDYKAMFPVSGIFPTRTVAEFSMKFDKVSLSTNSRLVLRPVWVDGLEKRMQAIYVPYGLVINSSTGLNCLDFYLVR